MDELLKDICNEFGINVDDVPTYDLVRKESIKAMCYIEPGKFKRRKKYIAVPTEDGSSFIFKEILD